MESGSETRSPSCGGNRGDRWRLGQKLRPIHGSAGRVRRLFHPAGSFNKQTSHPAKCCSRDVEIEFEKLSFAPSLHKWGDSVHLPGHFSPPYADATSNPAWVLETALTNSVRCSSETLWVANQAPHDARKRNGGVARPHPDPLPLGEGTPSFVGNSGS